MKIYISGLYSGTNPQPGVGIARSLREAYPNAHLVGVEYSTRCSGIHWKDFDEIWLQRPWDEINLDAHAEEIRKVLQDGGLWISSIDLELTWFADIFPDGHPNLLTPPKGALSQVSKPAITAHTGLPVRIPEFVTTERSDWDLHTFCRENDWKVWLKGPYYEAVQTRFWSEFQEKRHILSQAWATERLFVQANVTGYEESVCIAAYQGELLDCVRMRKRDLTDLSKTWAGNVSSVDEEFLRPLRHIVRDLKWTGGAELEMVRDAEDQLWLIEWNPRFPAWIHGSTITGHNLSAALIEGATGMKPVLKKAVASREFTRVVLEIPVRSEYPLAALPEPLGGTIGHSLKHPSGLIQFADKLHKLDQKKPSNSNGGSNHTVLADSPDGGGPFKASVNSIPVTFVNDLLRLELDELETPASLYFDRTATEYFTQAAEFARSLSTPEIAVTNAYSMKTNPDPRLLQLALKCGFLAEAISQLEVAQALSTGFLPSQLVLNGPAKWWRSDSSSGTEFYGIFCDSLGELESLIDKIKRGEIRTEVLGVRLRTPGIQSRFGISIGTPAQFERLLEVIKEIPNSVRFGIHFHMASSNIGVSQWIHLFQSMLRWCCSIEALSGTLIEMVDLGGGWFPDDVNVDAGSEMQLAISRVPDFLPNVSQILFEPGKALAQPSMALAMRILEVRESEDEWQDVIVDGSIAELPMYAVHPHRILHRDNEGGPWTTLDRGKTRLLGRLCMEHDIVAQNVNLPKGAAVGDMLVFCDAGAYDRSMSYVFGCG